ncbi:MAG: hypothetical protein H8E25_17640 [Planctomycetes bacterium]|nr:hypothetical protein [Planctomycetota bacterium]
MNEFKSKLDRRPLLWILLAVAVVASDMALVHYGYALSWQRLIMPLLSASFFSEYAQPG